MPSPKRESVINSNCGYRHQKRTQDGFRGNKNFTYKANYHANPKKMGQSGKRTKRNDFSINDEIQFALDAQKYSYLVYDNDNE